MTKKELLELEMEEDGAEIPLLDNIYLIPTRRKHDSGYYCMEIVGTTNDGKYMKKLATYSDVFDIGDVFESLPSPMVSIDIPECNVIHFYNINHYKFKVVWWGYSTFKMLAVEGDDK